MPTHDAAASSTTAPLVIKGRTDLRLMVPSLASNGIPTVEGGAMGGGGSLTGSISAASQSGLVRTFNAEVGGEWGCTLIPQRRQVDPSTGQGAFPMASGSSHSSPAVALEVHTFHPTHSFPLEAPDGYGSRSVAGVMSTSRLLPSPAGAGSCAGTPSAPYHLVPSPRGALTSLRAEPLPSLNPESGWSGQIPEDRLGRAGSVGRLNSGISSPGGATTGVLMSVKAIGVNFRDVLNVRGLAYHSHRGWLVDNYKNFSRLLSQHFPDSLLQLA